MAVADFVAEAFETDALQRPSPGAASATRTSVPGRGSTAVLLTDSAGNEGGAAGEALHAVALPPCGRAGGGGASFGVEIRTGAEVTSISTVDSRATGVVLTSGEAIEARAVVSGTDARRTLVSSSIPSRWGRRCAGEPAASGSRGRGEGRLPRRDADLSGCR
jgi:hypothetical protein